jgi:subtilisin family serine protease
MNIIKNLAPLILIFAFSNNTFAQDEIDSTSRNIYIINLEQKGLVHYQGGINGLRATSPIITGARKLDSKSDAALAYLQFLKSDLAGVKQSIKQTINRDIGKTLDYYYAIYGFSMSLTSDEANQIKNLPGVLSVEKDVQYELNTDAGPTFIGANSLWDGSAMPDGVTLNQGEGMVIGVLDTGVNMDHISFSDVSEDGYDFAAANPLGAGNFVPGSACSATFVCNNKLIGAWDFADDGTETDGPEDSNGHGSHTASTTAGNTISSLTGFTTIGGTTVDAPKISGVAPHAHLITYDVCVSSCSGAAISGAINQAIADQVDVISFSISGGTSPWNPSNSDRIYLDAVAAGIMVATSAGNTRDTNPTPFGDVNHLGPWLLSVANSSHNRALKNEVTITDPIPVPSNVEDLFGLLGAIDNFSGDINADLLYAGNVEPGNQDGCDPFTDNTAFTGKIALIIRGSCGFVDKINNAEAAGAIAAIIFNGVSDTPIAMGGIETTNIPAVMIGLADGNAIIDFISTVVATDVQAFISGTAVYTLINSLGDILNAGSLIGPNNSFNVTKPDINGPGTNIFAAYADAGAPAPQFNLLSGTSMSAPHIAGSSALMIAAQPTWTPSEIKSAMMMTADSSGTKGTGENVNADDVGSGTVDLTKATLAGLVMDETFANYLAADPATGGDPSTLNIPSTRNTICGTSCNWSRTLKDTLGVETNWTVSSATDGTFNLNVQPSSFTLNEAPNLDMIFENGFEDQGVSGPLTSQTLNITASGVPTTLNSMSFGEVILTEDNGLSPPLRITVSVNQVLPTEN